LSAKLSLAGTLHQGELPIPRGEYMLPEEKATEKYARFGVCLVYASGV